MVGLMGDHSQGNRPTWIRAEHVVRIEALQANQTVAPSFAAMVAAVVERGLVALERAEVRPKRLARRSQRAKP